MRCIASVANLTFYFFFANLANTIVLGSFSRLLTHAKVGTIALIIATVIGCISTMHCLVRN